MPNLFFEDTCSQVIWIYMMIKLFFHYDALSYMTGCFYYLGVDRCCWLSFLSVQGVRPGGCRGICGTPLDSRLSQGVGYLSCFIYDDIVLIRWYAIDSMMCCWHDLTWWLMMQADDSLLIGLTYGVKGPHTRVPESLRERYGQQPYHSLLALPPWLEL